jgi:very-short-patch-repair endonuclease
VGKTEFSMKNKIISYNPKLKKYAKELRKNMTLSEVLLWKKLKQKQVLGYDFDRQRPISEYIVDFYCKKLMLAIEIDGITHYNRIAEIKDKARQKKLESLGISFLRFDDLTVKRDSTYVVSVIEEWIKSNEPTPNPSKEGN